MNPAWSAVVARHHGEETPRALVFTWGDEQARIPCRLEGPWLTIKGYPRVYCPGRRAMQHVAEIVADAAEKALGPVGTPANV